MAQEPHLDDRYTNGVYYDLEAGEYCGIVRIDDTIGLTEPDSDDVYWTFDMTDLTNEDVVDTINKDFIQVSEEAVENPVHFVVDMLDWIHTQNSVNELPSTSLQETIDLRYARRQIEIVEK